MLKKDILKVIICVITGFIGLAIGGIMYKFIEIPLLEGIITYIVPFLFVLLLTKKFRAQKYFNFTGNFSKLFSYGWYVILAGCIFGGLNFLSLQDKVSISADVFIGFVISCICTATFEELLCRGLIQGITCDIGKRYNHSTIRYIVYASMVFALMHFLNLIDKPYLIIGTITQVIYAFSLGMLFGVIYYKAKNLTISIVLHAIFNILGSYIVLFMEQENVPQTDIPLISVVIQLVVMLPCILIAYRIYKKET